MARMGRNRYKMASGSGQPPSEPPTLRFDFEAEPPVPPPPPPFPARTAIEIVLSAIGGLFVGSAMSFTGPYDVLVRSIAGCLAMLIFAVTMSMALSGWLRKWRRGTCRWLVIFSLTNVLLLCGYGLMWLFMWLALNQQRKDANDNTVIQVRPAPNGDSLQSLFMVTNNSDVKFDETRIKCFVHFAYSDNRAVDRGATSNAYSDGFKAPLDPHGDVLSDRCLKGLRGFEQPNGLFQREVVKCIDVTVLAEYRLSTQPEEIQFKSARYTASSFPGIPLEWVPHPLILNTAPSYCAQPKQP
jgi:hypothetical protein